MANNTELGKATNKSESGKGITFDDVKFILLDIGCSVGVTIISFFLARNYLYLNQFESFVFSALVSLWLQVPLLAYRHTKGIKELGFKHTITTKMIKTEQVEIMEAMEVSKRFAPKCAKQEEVVDTLSKINTSFKEVYDDYTATKPFFVTLHEKKIDALNAEFNVSKRGGWLRVQINEFTALRREFIKTGKYDLSEVSICGPGIDWFSTPDGRTYDNHVNNAIADKHTVRRILVYKGNDLDTAGKAFYQLSKSRGYQVKKISYDTINSIYNTHIRQHLVHDFSVYGEKFMWQKSQFTDGETKANVSVGLKQILEYTNVFNEAWALCDPTDESEQKP